MKQCEKCGNTVEEGAAFCTHCGAAMNTSATPVNANTAPATASAPIINSAPHFEAPKKKLSGAMIALIIISVVCLAAGITGVVIALNSGNKSNSQVAVDTGSDGGSTIDATSSGTKVSYASYEFAIPKGYDYELTDVEGEEALLVSNSDDYAAMIYYGNDVTFTKIQNNADAVAESFAADFGTPVTANTTTAGGVDFVYFNVGKVESDGINVLYAASEADLYYFETTIMTNLGVDGVQYLGDVAEVLKTAQKKSTMDRTIGNGNNLSGIKRLNLNVVVEE